MDSQSGMQNPLFNIKKLIMRFFSIIKQWFNIRVNEKTEWQIKLMKDAHTDFKNIKFNKYFVRVKGLFIFEKIQIRNFTNIWYDC